MYDREVFGFVPGKYSIHRGFVGCRDLVQGFSLPDLVDDSFGFGAPRTSGGSGRSPGSRLRRLVSNDQPLADNQPAGSEVIPGFQLFDRYFEMGCNLGKSIALADRVGGHSRGG